MESAQNEMIHPATFSFNFSLARRFIAGYTMREVVASPMNRAFSNALAEADS
jgi:hypothetical protein